jgi:hypothetical protein
MKSFPAARVALDAGSAIDEGRPPNITVYGARTGAVDVIGPTDEASSGA